MNRQIREKNVVWPEKEKVQYMIDQGYNREVIERYFGLTTCHLRTFLKRNKMKLRYEHGLIGEAIREAEQKMKGKYNDKSLYGTDSLFSSSRVSKEDRQNDVGEFDKMCGLDRYKKHNDLMQKHNEQ
jgi:hypothetical protein